jgi:hypothetical protein
MNLRALGWSLGLMAVVMASLAQEGGAPVAGRPASDPSAPPLAAPAASAASSSTRWVAGLDIAAEQTRVRTERAAAQARQAEEEAVCRKSFAVTDCLDRTRRRWQPVLADLRRQEVALNDADRKQRSAEQQRKLEEKNSPQAQEEAAQRRAQALIDHEERQSRAAAKASGPAPGGKPRDPQDAAERKGPDLTPDQAAANAQAHARRLEEAQARKERLRQRQAERSKPAASALPLPP